jgi:hypothetical protein
MKWLIGAACVAIIASSAVYLAGQYNAYVARQEAANAEVQQIIARATAKKRLNDDYKAWWEATKANDKLVHDEVTKPCFVAVNKLRSIETAKAANVAPFYKDDPADLRTQVNACVSKGEYTSAQVADVLN